MEIQPQESFFDEINLEIIIFNNLNRKYYEEVFIQEPEIFSEIDTGEYIHSITIFKVHFFDVFFGPNVPGTKFENLLNLLLIIKKTKIILHNF